ncbi:endolytic transglycosylase MltG [Geomicrobium sp. JSM 1781026]|uniref:endolytic transglycosylase MltG n=1 Tax=Geomicrobium sp. JSM 1781026 TaxID=3344580 RepID=UPI0035BF132B
MAEERNEKVTDPLAKRAETSRKVRKIVLITLGAMVLLIGGAVLYGYFYIQSAVSPVDASSEEVVEVEIPIGSTATGIGEILEDEGLIQNATIFRYYARYQNFTGFQAGNYELSKSMDMDDMMHALQDGVYMEEYAHTFIIPEGHQLEQIAVRIADETDYDEEDIMDVLTDDEWMEDLYEEYSFLEDDIFDSDVRYALEGYLFPAAYDFLEEDTPIEEMIESMLQRMAQVYESVQTDIVEENGDFGPAEELNVHEVLTLASIIEREAATAEDRRLISGVLHNRLEEGMRLEVDPTVAYAIGEHRYMTSFDDLETEDPYNTYRYGGLPPGPIASPGEDSIRSVFAPEESEYLFFYARFGGEVIYSNTYEEHNEVHQQYRDEWIEGQAEEDEEDS